MHSNDKSNFERLKSDLDRDFSDQEIQALKMRLAVYAVKRRLISNYERMKNQIKTIRAKLWI